jgi:hypothetical protein
VQGEGSQGEASYTDDAEDDDEEEGSEEDDEEEVRGRLLDISVSGERVPPGFSKLTRHQRSQYADATDASPPPPPVFTKTHTCRELRQHPALNCLSQASCLCFVFTLRKGIEWAGRGGGWGGGEYELLVKLSK